MFPMTDTVRDAMKTQGELATQLTGQALDWQLEAMKIAEKQMTQGIGAVHSAAETSVKATKAMQKAWIDGLATQSK